MNSSRMTSRILEDVKINVKMKLSGLWVALMFFYLYRDVLGFYAPGHLEALIAGEVAGIPITQVFLLGSAVLMAIPSLMVFLSLALKAKANRWVNIILGIVHIAILAGTSFVGEISPLYIFYVIVEFVLMALIVWHAWRWPAREA
jgi:hypothetical protein